MDFKTTPYPHQLRFFERFKDSEYFALFMDMGTGKTKVALDIAAHKFLTGQITAMLVIAPNHVHEQWVNEQCPMHLAVPYRPFVWHSSWVGRSYYTNQLREFTVSLMPEYLKVLAVNVEAFQSDTIVPFIADFVHSNECFIVVDEGTRIKHDKAKRTKTVHKLAKYGQRAILTGTPVAQSPFNLWSMLEFLKTGYFGCNYFVFQHRYGILMKGTNQYTGKNFNVAIDEKTYVMVTRDLERLRLERNGPLMPNDYETVSVMRGTSEKNVRFIEEHPTYTKYKRLDELRDYVAKDVGAASLDEVAPHMPPKVYETLYVDMSMEQKRVYKSLKEELMAEYAGKYVTVANKLALTTRLQQVTGGFFPYLEEEKHYSPERCEWYSKVIGAGQLIGNSNPKFDALLEDLEEVNFDNTKVIIWAHFVPELKYIYEQLKDTYETRLYYGGTPDDERARTIAEFKAGKVDIFVANQATAGFGLNLQLGKLSYFFSNDQVVENRLQAEGRPRRVDVPQVCVYKDVVVRKTYDEKILALIRAGRDMNDYFKDVTVEELLADQEEDVDGTVF
jgi:Superfamily II DNA/RNA helicases, SNF2 family